MLIVGDFNCKIGTIIDGNKEEEVTVGGKILRKMMTENKLTVVSSLKCEEDKDLTTEHLLTCQRRDSRIFTEMDLEETKKEEILLTVNEIETKLDELNLKQHEKDI